MDWSSKAMLTAASVAALLALARLFGHRLAGVIAGLPTVTGPALIWLALDHGADYAIEASIGSIAACALCAVFALAYERASRRGGIIIALAVATGASLLLALPLHWAAGGVGAALAVAAAFSFVAYAAIPEAAHEITPPRRLRGELLVTALVSGVVSGMATLVAPKIGPFWAGVIASPPLIAAAVAAHQHAFASPASLRRFLRGYVVGLQGRAVFGTGFALLLWPAGITAAALAATIAACLFTSASVRGFDRADALLAATRRALAAPRS